MNVAYKGFKEILFYLKVLLPLLIVGVVCVAVVIIALNQEDHSQRIMAEIEEEVKVYGVKSFVMHERMYNSKNLPYAALFIVESRGDFLQKIQLYQPKIIYYYKTSVMTYISFSFYEDEAEKQILYRWICEYAEETTS